MNAEAGWQIRSPNNSTTVEFAFLLVTLVRTVSGVDRHKANSFGAVHYWQSLDKTQYLPLLPDLTSYCLRVEGCWPR